MTINIRRLKKDIQELAEVDNLKKQIETMSREHEKVLGEVRELKKEVAEISRKLAAIGPGGKRVRTPLLIDIIEDIAAGMEQPIKVTDLRETLMKDKRVKSKAENFYAVIATAMNNSPKFDKLGPGVYRYKEDKINP